MAQNVTFKSKNNEKGGFCSPRQFPFVNAFGADFLHFTISATLQSDKTNMAKMAQNVTFITKKWTSVVNLTTGIHFYTHKRNVLTHFWDLDSVTLKVSGNGKVQKVSPKGIDWQRETAEWQHLDLKNGSERYVYR